MKFWLAVGLFGFFSGTPVLGETLSPLDELGKAASEHTLNRISCTVTGRNLILNAAPSSNEKQVQLVITLADFQSLKNNKSVNIVYEHGSAGSVVYADVYGYSWALAQRDNPGEPEISTCHLDVQIQPQVIVSGQCQRLREVTNEMPGYASFEIKDLVCPKF